MEGKKYSKVLVVSHNVFSSTSNMGKTMASFFHDWPKTKLAQLYFHTEVPNLDLCERYFRITDFDMVESILKFKKPGKELNVNDIKLNRKSSRVDDGIMADIYQMGRKRKPYMYLLRNCLWGTNNWKTLNLMKWIDDYNPEVLFYAATDYVFSIKIALSICKIRNIPMVVFIGDDYYFVNTHKRSLINWFNKKIYRSIFSSMFLYSTHVIAASDKMQKDYTKEFNKQVDAIMTPTKVNKIKIENQSDHIKISYIGNLGHERWKSLIEIGNCLKSIGHILDVYSGEKKIDVINQLNLKNGIRFHGEIDRDKVKDIINSSTLLIHVESMNEISREKTKYSMSTKIAESLGSGICLFAYGPNNVSSIEYLIENSAACTVTRKKDLLIKLQEIINSDQLRKKYIKSALKLANDRHNFETNVQLFHKLINRSSKKN